MTALSGIARRLAANAGRLLRFGPARRLLPRGGGAWVLLRLGPETGEHRPLALGIRSGPGLLDALQVLRAAASDERVDGVVLRFHGALPGWSKALALRRAVDELRAAGKSIVAWGESLGASEYLVASGADRVWLPASGSLFLVGLSANQYFVRGLLEQLQVQPEVVRIGSYKTAGEMLTRDAMSPEQREQLEGWLDDLYAALVDGVAAGRSLASEVVRERIDGGPYPAALAAEQGLIDGCLYPDDIPEALVALTRIPAADRPGPRRPRLVDAQAYLALHASDPGWRPLWRELPRFAYVVASGSIGRGAGGGVASDSFRQLMGELAEDGEVRGVVLRVDSPGGDGVASDLIHRAVSRVAKEKPVVVSMGDVAASGGYYLAAAADAIYAEAATLTGSIGVVGGKLNLEGLYRRLGIAKDAIERGARAGLQSEVRGFTPEERGALRREMEALYDTFLARVAEGRRLPLETVRRLGQGRVWSGLRAVSSGLVDAVGGPLEALADARRRAGLAEAERFLIDFHPKRPRLAALIAALRSRGL